MASTTPTIRLKNTYTKTIETFEPLDPAGQEVTMYTCGPTVYSYAHIGNFRSFLFADVLRRFLERCGYRVRQVMNITDVGHMTEDHLADAAGEDKLARAARELGSDPYAVAAHFEAAFARDATALGLANYQGEEATRRELHPQATRHVAEMLAMIQTLLERDYAYCDSAGQVYFNIAAFPEYGRLSGKDIDELEEGARVEVRSEKRDPRDFALWKVDTKHLMQWDPHSPDGWPDGDYQRLQTLVPGGIDARVEKGFPGWHIECSAMSRAHLGDCIDLHSGGEDNIFPHHECEIAQSFGATLGTVPAPGDAPDAGQARRTFARYWIHGRHLLVDNKKMSKRDGTFFTARDLFDPRGAGRPDLAARLEEVGFPGGRVPPRVLRYALIANQYIQPMNFNFDLLGQARTSVDRLQSLRDRMSEIVASAGQGNADDAGDELRGVVAEHAGAFDRAMSDNLNLPNALAAVFALVRDANQRDLGPGDARLVLDALDGIDSVLGVLDHGARSGLVDAARIAAILATEPLPAADELLARSSLDGEAVEILLALRARARKDKSWAVADAIRDHLKATGVITEDTPQGVRWKLGQKA